MLSPLKIIITVIIVLVAIAAIIVGIVLGVRSSGGCGTFDAPSEITFSRTSQNILFSWLKAEVPDYCEVTYVIHYWIDDGEKHEVITKNLSYEIPPLIIPCSALYVEIWTVNESGEQSNERLVGNYTETFIEVPAVGRVTFPSTTSGLTLTYMEDVYLGKCKPKYAITLITDLGLFEYETEERLLVIAEDKYCSLITATVRRVVGEASSKTSFGSYNIQMEAVEDLQLLIEEPNKLRVSWAAHPHEEKCSLNYRITYKIDEVDAYVYVRQTAALTTTFDIIYCSHTSISVTAFNVETLSTTRTSSEDATQILNQVDKITNLFIYGYNSNYVAQWSPVGIPICATRYVVTLLSDVDTSTEIVDKPIYNIPESKYCSTIQIQVIALVNELTGEPESITRILALQSVQDLNVNQSSSTELMVVWTAHPKRDLCGLQYKVVYTVGDDTDKEEITSTAVAVFEFVYCADATVFVTAFNEQIESDKVSVNATRFPTSTGAVQNVNIDVVDTNATISWALPTNVNLCDIQHTVTATNDEDPELQSTCTGFTTCTLTLNDFCSSTTFVISAIDIPGDPYEETYDCSSSF